MGSKPPWRRKAYQTGNEAAALQVPRKDGCRSDVGPVGDAPPVVLMLL